MRLSDILLNPKSNDFLQVESFLGERRLGVGKYKKIDIGNILLNHMCKCCCNTLTFSARGDTHCTIIDAKKISIDCALVCPHCSQILPVWFLIEFENDPFSSAPKARILKRSVSESDFAHVNDKFSDLFKKAEQAYHENLGAGSIVYLRKILEIITIQVADAEGINIKTKKGSRRSFYEILKDTDQKCSFVPKEFSDNSYKLFRELSEVIHGDFDELLALQKYEAWHRLVTGVVENVKNNKELTNAMGELGWLDQ